MEILGHSEELITAQELADAISLSVDTIWRYTREKRIPFVKIGSRQYRYNKEEVLKALAGDAAAFVRGEPTSYRPYKKMTYEDYAALPEEPGFRFEILDGMLTRTLPLSCTISGFPKECIASSRITLMR